MAKKKKLTPAERSAQRQVGDGKLPNLYWVTVCSGWYEAQKQKDGSVYLEDSAELYPNEEELPSMTMGPFPTFREAEESAERAIETVVVPVGEKGYHRVCIEDRLSGEVYEAAWRVHITQTGPYRVPRFDFSRRTDIDYSRKMIERKGGVFA